MKKSVILLIFIIYAASITVVGFYGIKIKVYDEKIMVEDVICENLSEFNGIDCSVSEVPTYKDLFVNQGINYYAAKRYLDEYSEVGYVFYVKFAVLPRTATVQGVEYVFVSSSDGSSQSTSGNTDTEQTAPKYTIVDNKDGTAKITIYKQCSVVFSVRPTDKASDAIKKVRIDFIKY